MKNRIALVLAGLLAASSALEVGEGLWTRGSLQLASPAEARVGRPLTPVSVAGVGRRTVRRCAVGVYYC
jgi:hypothetical protein